MDIKTRQCWLIELHPELRSYLASQFPIGETVIACFETTKIDRVGFGPIDSEVISAGIVTPTRAIVLRYFGRGWKPKDRGVAADCMNLTDAVTVTTSSAYEVNLLWGGTTYSTVTVHGHGGTVAFDIDSLDNAARFAQILRTAIEQARASQPQLQQSPAQRLRELAKLHEEKLISDDEFESQRKRILAEM